MMLHTPTLFDANKATYIDAFQVVFGEIYGTIRRANQILSVYSICEKQHGRTPPKRLSTLR